MTDKRDNRRSEVGPLTGKRILVTAGPCREPLDPVRYISNRSSGKMGYAIAEAAINMGAVTTLISGPSCLKPPEGVQVVPIETTDQLYRTVFEWFMGCDCLIMAAAPADFTVKNVASRKIKKSETTLALELTPTVDILKTVGQQKKPGQILVGFALETDNGIENARAKLIDKNLDLILLNNPREEGAGFDHDTNCVTLIRPDGDPEPWPLQPKTEIASSLLDYLVKLI